tara:strand:+ start:608 stop:1060 length:453 start_codon:yes stop_codon:yes gene_type:complete
MSDKFTIQYVKEPKWCNLEKTIFECVVKYNEFDYEMPVGVNPIDQYSHIQELWINGNKGDYGIITEYEPPAPTPVYIPTAEDNKQSATIALQQTDWITIADVGNPAMSNPFLSNQDEFIAYRNEVRQYAVYPVDGNVNWPVVPQEVWTNS